MSLGINLGDQHVRYFSFDDPDNPVDDALDGFENCVIEVWYMDQMIHRDGKPAVIVRDIETGNIRRSAYYENGLLHRSDGPALEEIVIDPGILDDRVEHYKALQYVRFGQEERDDGPSRIETSIRTGVVFYERYCSANRKHRLGGMPAEIERDIDTGVITVEQYQENGQLHRTNGPAYIARDPHTGVIITEEYYQRGKPYREDGPTVVIRDAQSGQVVSEDSSSTSNRCADAPSP